MKRIDKDAQMLNVADVGSLEATVKALTGCQVRQWQLRQSNRLPRVLRIRDFVSTESFRLYEPT